MENLGIPSNREEENSDENTQTDKADTLSQSAANITDVQPQKLAKDDSSVRNKINMDNSISVGAMNAAGGATKQNADHVGGTIVKTEEIGEDRKMLRDETKRTVSVQNDDHSHLSNNASDADLKEGKPSLPNILAAAAHNDRNKSGSSSSKDDATTINKKSKQNLAPTLSGNQGEKTRDSKDPIMKKDTISMDVDSLDTNEPDSCLEEPIKTTAENNVVNSNITTTYSTRGRSTESTAVDDKPESIHMRDTFEESPRPKDPPSGVSFLVEAMTEEERRTRTRFLPDVDGMHMLRKNEVKEDITLASSLPSIASPSGLETRAGRLRSTSGKSSDSMDVDGNEVNLTINDEVTTTIEISSSTITIPSDAFVAPDGVIVGDTDTSIEVKECEPTVQSPSIVESVMSFNPPRPPESVGGKKKHRMIRWERRPEDIEVDMKNYRRTVQRTRQELQKSEAQYERLEMIDAHLRHHFLNHLGLLDQEYNHLQGQLDFEVEKLIDESVLVGSRTRSRNLTKVDVVMRDVFAILTRNDQKELSMDGTANEESVLSDFYPGIGGLNSRAFIDWDRCTELESMSPCISWLEPGQRVTTLYGEGIVLSVIPPESPRTNDSARILRANDCSKSDPHKRNINEMREENSNNFHDKNRFESLLPLRVKVRLKYGIGVFVADSILKMESTSHFTDAKLAKRWKGMIGSAFEVGSCIDSQGMAPDAEKMDKGNSNCGERETQEISSTDNGGDLKLSKSTFNAAKQLNNDFLPIGASLLPTKFGRGNFLQNMTICDIEETLQNVLYRGNGVLGRKSNPGVVSDVRKWEDDEQEYLNLRASVLQLKNTLYRQRRIGLLNKRTTTSMNDRYLRAEELVSEMRSDLKSLKRRLGDELEELGITDGMANKILFQFYQGHQEEDKGDASTPKRLRRASSVIGEMLTDIDVGNSRREGDSRDSMDDQGTDDLSGDDVENRRPAKKIRAGISVE